jgi:hypothetical protein
MKPQSLAGIVRYSQDPDRLAKFYREALDIPVAPTRHGPVKTHHEALFGGVHFAIWGASEGRGIVPTFRVKELAAASAEMARLGVPAKFGPIDLGEGKLLSSFLDPDGQEFRLIQLQ